MTGLACASIHKNPASLNDENLLHRLFRIYSPGFVVRELNEDGAKSELTRGNIVQSGGLRRQSPGETAHANNGALVQAARDDFVRVTGFHLEGELTVFDLDDARGASDSRAGG